MRMRMLFTLVCLLGLAGLSAQAYRLQFKDTKDAVRTFKTTMQMKGSMDMMGQTVPMDMGMTMTMVEKVLSINATGAAALSSNMTDGKMTIKMTLPGSKDTKKTELPFPLFGMTYTRTPSGKVTDMKMTGDLDPKLLKQMNSMTSQFQYPGQGMEFPDKELKIGDSWDVTQSFPAPTGSSLDIKAKYTLVGTKVVSGKTFLLLKSDISADIKDFVIKIPGADDGKADDSKLTMSMTISGTGTTLFDEQVGEMSDTTLHMNMDMTMSSKGTKDMTMKMKMAIDGDMIRQ